MRKFVLPLLLIFIMASCTMTALKSPADMSAKELATWAMGIYNSQYDNYQTLAARTDLSEEHKNILRKKKAIMVELWPYLQLYTTYVDTGAIPTAELETKIINLVDRLIMETL